MADRDRPRRRARGQRSRSTSDGRDRVIFSFIAKLVEIIFKFLLLKGYSRDDRREPRRDERGGEEERGRTSYTGGGDRDHRASGFGGDRDRGSYSSGGGERGGFGGGGGYGDIKWRGG